MAISTGYPRQIITYGSPVFMVGTKSRNKRYRPMSETVIVVLLSLIGAVVEYVNQF